MADKKSKLSLEEIQGKLSSAKERLAEAKDALGAFCKENGLKKDEDHSAHENADIASKWKTLKAEVDEKASRVEKWTTRSKEAKKSKKGSKGGGIKNAKYTYPKNVKTSDEKKKYRSEIRAKAKRAGVTVEQYLADPEKYAKALEKASLSKKSKKEEPAKKKKKVKKEKAAPTESSKSDGDGGDDDED